MYILITKGIDKANAAPSLNPVKDKRYLAAVLHAAHTHVVVGVAEGPLLQKLVNPGHSHEFTHI